MIGYALSSIFSTVIRVNEGVNNSTLVSSVVLACSPLGWSVVSVFAPFVAQDINVNLQKFTYTLVNGALLLYLINSAANMGDLLHSFRVKELLFPRLSNTVFRRNPIIQCGLGWSYSGEEFAAHFKWTDSIWTLVCVLKTRLI
jgi:hypothetical protein